MRYRSRVMGQVAVLAMVVSPAVAIASAGTPAAATLASSPVAGTIISGYTDSGGPYCVANKNAVNSPGNPVQLSVCNGQIGHQLWILEPDSSIRMYFPYAAGTDSSECLLANSSGDAIIYACNGSQGEKWEPWGSNQNQLYNDNLQECLTESGSGQQLSLTTCHSSDPVSQQWNLPQDSLSTEAATAALGLAAMYDPTTGLFSDSLNSGCPIRQNTYVNTGDNLQYQFGQQCWWWSAKALDSLIDFDEQAGKQWTPSGPWSGTGSNSIYSDLANTYQAICSISKGPRSSAPDNGQCPVTDPAKSATGWTAGDGDGLLAYQDPEEWPNQFENDYFDDTSNWAVTWLNAYKLTGNLNYLYLAESLWYYITRSSWDTGTDKWANPSGYPLSPGKDYPNGWQQSWQCAGGGVYDTSATSTAGIVQFVHQANDTDFGEAAKNIGANSLYLWLSAWLYAATGNKNFFDGIPDKNGTLQGGLYNEAQWLLGMSKLVHMYYSVPGQPGLDAQGALFLFDGKVDPVNNCYVDPSQQKEIQHMGTALSALSAMYPAIEKASKRTTNIPVDYTAYFAQSKSQSEAYYLNAADNLAEGIIGSTATGPLVRSGGPQYIDGSPGAGVLSETCISQYSDWPDGCDVTGSGNVWLPGKGIFVSAASCLNADLTTFGTADGGLSAFMSADASSVWNDDQHRAASTSDVNQFGFLWDNNLYQGEAPTANTSWPDSGQPGQGYATQGSALEALSAQLSGSTAMCGG